MEKSFSTKENKVKNALALAFAGLVIVTILVAMFVIGTNVN
jgi:hypothetical protein